MQTLRMHIEKHALDVTVTIGQNLWEKLNGFLRDDFPRHAIFVISDLNVLQLYKRQVTEALGSLAGFGGILPFPAGEESKTRLQKALLEDELFSRKAGRDTVIVALGGGVCGDLAGYVAATFNRGVPLVHVPTTLLAQVDSSIGGKVGINTTNGKNLIGTFYQPRAVFADVDFLETLPADEFTNGMAEIIKYAVTLDDELWRWIEDDLQSIQNRHAESLVKIITRSIQLKTAVVQADEKENNYRSILNFGHTVGHAIETLSNYQIRHGFAVAQGMRVAAALSHRLLGYPAERLSRLNKLLDDYNLPPVEMSGYSLEDIWNCIRFDKKARQQTPLFTLLDEQGKPKLFYPVSKKELKDALLLA